MKEYPKIFRYDSKDWNAKKFYEEARPKDVIVVEEKIDGSNFRFEILEDGKIAFGSKNRTITDGTKDLSEIKKRWRKGIRYITERVNKGIKRHGVDQFVGKTFFGEYCIPHTMKYDWKIIPLFLGFDVMDENGEFLDFMLTREYYYKLNLETVPIVRIMQYEFHSVEEYRRWLPKSKYSSNLAEGIVLKNNRTKRRVKYVNDAFREKRKDTFGSSAKIETDREQKIAAKYVTNARIKKAIHQLLDRGEALDMKMMVDLPSMVLHDVFNEELANMIKNKVVVDLRALKKIVAKRCRAVLSQMIELAAINEKEELNVSC